MVNSVTGLKKIVQCALTNQIKGVVFLTNQVQNENHHFPALAAGYPV